MPMIYLISRALVSFQAKYLKLRHTQMRLLYQFPTHGATIFLKRTYVALRMFLNKELFNACIGY